MRTWHRILLLCFDCLLGPHLSLKERPIATENRIVLCPHTLLCKDQVAHMLTAGAVTPTAVHQHWVHGMGECRRLAADVCDALQPPALLPGTPPRTSSATAATSFCSCCCGAQPCCFIGAQQSVVQAQLPAVLATSHGVYSCLSNAAAAVQVHEFGHRVGMAHATVYRLNDSADAKVRVASAAARMHQQSPVLQAAACTPANSLNAPHRYVLHYHCCSGTTSSRYQSHVCAQHPCLPAVAS